MTNLSDILNKVLDYRGEHIFIAELENNNYQILTEDKEVIATIYKIDNSAVYWYTYLLHNKVLGMIHFSELKVKYN